jgi:SAM-dependent methyltransferase
MAGVVTHFTLAMMSGRSLGAMRGYDRRSYGDGFADVYDDWYGDVTDVDATVARMLALAGASGRVLELGVGTGRLAVPMATAGLDVVGIDSSDAMLARLADRDPAQLVEGVRGDMIDDLPAGPFAAVLVAYNTIFNVLDQTGQQRLFDNVAERLAPGGAFVVEAFVPDDGLGAAGSTDSTSEVRVRSMAVDHVVLSVSVHHPEAQLAEGQFVEFTQDGGVRLRPWSIRWATVGQLDAMAAAAGFELAQRFSDMAGSPFTEHSGQHVSIYRRDDAP